MSRNRNHIHLIDRRVLSFRLTCTGSDFPYTRPVYSYVFCVISTLFGSKLGTTDHYYRITHTRKSQFLAKVFIHFDVDVCNDRNRLIVIVNKQAD